MHRKLQASSEVDIPTWNFFKLGTGNLEQGTGGSKLDRELGAGNWDRELGQGTGGQQKQTGQNWEQGTGRGNSALWLSIRSGKSGVPRARARCTPEGCKEPLHPPPPPPAAAADAAAAAPTTATTKY